MASWVLEIRVLEPIFKQRIEDHGALIVPLECKDLLFHQGILQAAHIRRRVQGVLPDDLGGAELGVAIYDGLKQADLEGRQIIHSGDEPPPMDGQYRVKRLQKHRLHNIALGQGVANGGEMIDIEQVALK